MAGRIPQQFIDDLMTRVDIVDVIDAHVPLKKGGRDYMACCPFHNEKTPSFTVSRDKQFYHCFGCGAHGTALGFLMNYAHMEFVEAVHELATRVGMTVPKTAVDNRAAAQSQNGYEILRQCERFYRQQLKTHEQGRQAIEYLKQRGLNGDIAAEYGIGFAPPGWHTLTAALGQGAEKPLRMTGMLIEKEGGGSYDRFRERIMFPIRDGRGRVIGFGGRVLGNDSPKYLNSPETPIFHKGRELYGLYEARQAVRQLNRLLVVEGYMDVVMLARHGIRYAVATLGTATTAEHLERMFRIVPEIVFCFDGDRAGRAAAWRALENTLPVLSDGRQARFMFLPEGEDPDSLIRQEKQAAFEARIESSVTLSTFFYDELSSRVDSRDIDGYARLIELARPLLAKIRQGVFKEELIARLAQRAGISERNLRVLIEREERTARQRESGRATGVTTGQRGVQNRPSLMRTAITLLLRHPQLAPLAGDPAALAALDMPGAVLLAELVQTLRERPDLNSAALIERWRETEFEKTLLQLASQGAEMERHIDAEAEFKDAVRRLKSQRLEQRLDALLEKERSGMALTDDEKSEMKQIYRDRVAAG